MYNQFNYCISPDFDIENISHVQGCDVVLINLNKNLFIESTIIPLVQKKEINKYKLERDRLKRILARNYLYNYLYKYYGITDFSISFNQYKKPYLSKYPDLHFNISYSMEYIAVCISDRFPVGIDIEYIDLQLDVSALSNEIMHQSEQVHFNRLKSKGEQQEFFFKVFSAKEAIIKAMGMGLYFDVKQLNLIGSDVLFKELNLIEMVSIIQGYKYFLCINTEK